MGKFLCEHAFSLIGNTYPRMQLLLSRGNSMLSFIKKMIKLLSRVTITLNYYYGCRNDPVSLHLCQYLVYQYRRRQWHPTPVLLPERSHGWRSLVGCSPWGRWVRHDWTTSLSRIGEGNGNPLQCSCLENPRDGGAWWAAISGVAQSQACLKHLSSSSSGSSVSVYFYFTFW